MIVAFGESCISLENVFLLYSAIFMLANSIKDELQIMEIMPDYKPFIPHGM